MTDTLEALWEWANHHDHAEDAGKKMEAIATRALNHGEAE